MTDPCVEHSHDMPRVPFGPVEISRLVLGANPINGGSHLSGFVNHQMRRYFTEETVLGLLARCREHGVNTWQSGEGNLALWRRSCAESGPLHYLSLAAANPDDPGQVERLAGAGVLGIAHHGEVTDSLFKAGRLREAREFCRQLRDAGVQVGVSTHMPAVIEAVEEQGWDIDFYMACVYERHRTREELLALLGHVPIPVREVYLESDPPRMYEAIRQTSKTCLAFKILAAGRLCDQPETVEDAFRLAFEGIKPRDAVIVGIYPEYSDQLAQDVELTKRYGRG
ncbi:MAG: hypothetical protein FJX74_25485 [Armatimonadetes bacterium]|nr:hypothetical protein [Armatimonadota bacterium]